MEYLLSLSAKSLIKIGAGIFTYYGFSYVMLKRGGIYKELERRPFKFKPNEPGNFSKCWHISHRGGSFENIENTMKSFNNAARLKTDMFELDVYLTSD